MAPARWVASATVGGTGKGWVASATVGGTGKGGWHRDDASWTGKGGMAPQEIRTALEPWSTNHVAMTTIAEGKSRLSAAPAGDSRDDVVRILSGDKLDSQKPVTAEIALRSPCNAAQFDHHRLTQQ